MKRIVTTLCALAVIMVGSIPSEAPEEVPMAEGAPGAETPSQGVDLSALKQPLLAGGVILALAVGGVVAFKKIKERR